MDIPDHVKVEQGYLWVRGFHGVWRKVLKQQDGEPVDLLFQRWMDTKSEEMARNAMSKEDETIAKIMSWLIPIFLFALAYLLSSFVPD